MPRANYAFCISITDFTVSQILPTYSSRISSLHTKGVWMYMFTT